MITGDQIICHAVGDYILQSSWMSEYKRYRSFPCLVHVTLYTLPFLLVTHSWPALGVILVTHFLIDRFGLARYLVWLKNHLAPPFSINLDPKDPEYLACERLTPPWKECQQTGYHDQSLSPAPIWMRTWLMIFADNILHVVINGVAITYL
jgi:hypothetical protein